MPYDAHLGAESVRSGCLRRLRGNHAMVFKGVSYMLPPLYCQVRGMQE